MVLVQHALAYLPLHVVQVPYIFLFEKILSWFDFASFPVFVSFGLEKASAILAEKKKLLLVPRENFYCICSGRSNKTHSGHVPLHGVSSFKSI